MATADKNSALNEGVAKREVFAWAMYDFANSGYTTVVLTAVFNAYFVSVIAGGAPWAVDATKFPLREIVAIRALLTLCSSPSRPLCFSVWVFWHNRSRYLAFDKPVR